MSILQIDQSSQPLEQERGNVRLLKIDRLPPGVGDAGGIGQALEEGLRSGSEERRERLAFRVEGHVGQRDVIQELKASGHARLGAPSEAAGSGKDGADLLDAVDGMSEGRWHLAFEPHT